MALVEPIADVWGDAPGWLNPRRWVQISVLQAVTMLIAGPMGFAYAMINAPAQTVLHERAPPEMRGRIFATQVVSANFVSLLPLLIIGAMTDLLSVTYVLLLIAGTVVGIAAISNAVGGRDIPPLAPPPEPVRTPQEVST
jgi:MFS family permease